MLVFSKKKEIALPVITKRIDKPKKGGNTWWSDKQRRQAVASYLVLGKISLVSHVSGIPEITLRKWKASAWWKEAEEELKRGDKLELKGKLGNIVGATLVQLEDRVQNGDYKWNPQTKVFDRRPINAAVANKIASDLIDRSLVLEKKADQVKETDEVLEARLLKLKEEMIKFAKAKTIEGEVIRHSLAENI
jgi:hypothetical protein